MPWQTSVFPLLIVVGTGGTPTGFFFYNGTPGKGKLIAQIVAPGTTADPFGNAVGAVANFGKWSAGGALLQHFGIDQNGDTYLANTAGLTVIHEHSADGSIWFYNSSGEGLGNLIASAAPAAGTDTPGNPYLAGLTSYVLIATAGAAGRWAINLASGTTGLAGTFAGLTLQNQTSPLNVPPVVLGSGTTAAGSELQLTSGAASALGTPALIVLEDSTLSGLGGGLINLIATEIDLAGYVRLLNITAPAAAASQASVYSHSGQLATVNPQGLNLNLEGAQSDLTAFTVTAATFQRISAFWTIPANDAIAGATYRLRVVGQGTQGSTAQTLFISGQISGSNFGLSGINSGFASVSAAFSFWAELEIVCVTTGVSGTFQVSKIATAADASGHSAQSVDSTAGATFTVNTTISNTFDAIAEWASTTGAPTMTCRRSVFERVV